MLPAVPKVTTGSKPNSGARKPRNFLGEDAPTSTAHSRRSTLASPPLKADIGPGRSMRLDHHPSACSAGKSLELQRGTELRTGKQQLGDWGEEVVAKTCHCPSCKKSKTLKLLPANFKCADIICDFCGYLTQVKTAKVTDVESIPKYVLGGAWGPQKARMEAAIYFSLYLVLTTDDRTQHSIFFLSKDLQEESMFAPRKALSSSAKRAGWQGFRIELAEMADRFVRLL